MGPEQIYLMGTNIPSPTSKTWISGDAGGEEDGLEQ